MPFLQMLNKTGLLSTYNIFSAEIYATNCIKEFRQIIGDIPRGASYFCLKILPISIQLNP